MSKFRNTLVGIVASLFVHSAYASDVNVGGVVWDPDYNAGIESDFIGRFDFTQWFSTIADTKGSADSFGSAMTIADVTSTVAGLGGAADLTGIFLSGVGEFKELNGYEAIISSLTGGQFCPSCELTFAFGGLELRGNNTFDITNAWAQIYVDNTPDFDVPPGTPGNPASNAVDGLLWLDLSFTDIVFNSFGSGVSSGFVDASLQIVGGLAAGNFNPGTLDYNGSAFNNRSGPGTRYSTGGNGSLTGNSIPEPHTLAIMGLGLICLSGLARKKARK